MLAGRLHTNHRRADRDGCGNENGWFIRARRGNGVGSGNRGRCPHIAGKRAASRGPIEPIRCATARGCGKRNLSGSKCLICRRNWRDADPAGRDQARGGNHVAFGIGDRERVGCRRSQQRSRIRTAAHSGRSDIKAPHAARTNHGRAARKCRHQHYGRVIGGRRRTRNNALRNRRGKLHGKSCWPAGYRAGRVRNDYGK